MKKEREMNMEFMLLSLYGNPRLTFDQTCKAIGFALQTGYNRRNQGTFPIKMTGSPLMADVRDVAAYLDALRGDEEEE